MSVPAASNVSSVLDGFWLIILFILGHVFLSVCTSGSLWWHARHRCEFHLAECCSPISLIEFCSGIQLDYLELIFWVLFQFSGSGCSFSITFRVLYPVSPELQCSPSVWWEQALSSAVCKHLALFLPSSWMGLPPPWAVSLHSRTEEHFAELSVGPLAGFRRALSSALSSLVPCPADSICPGVPWLSTPFPRLKKSLSGSTSFPPLCAVTWTLL